MIGNLLPTVCLVVIVQKYALDEQGRRNAAQHTIPRFHRIIGLFISDSGTFFDRSDIRGEPFLLLASTGGLDIRPRQTKVLYLNDCDFGDIAEKGE